MTATDATFLALGILAIVALCLWSVDRELTERARRQRLQRQIALLDYAASEAGVIRIFNEGGELYGAARSLVSSAGASPTSSTFPAVTDGARALSWKGSALEQPAARAGNFHRA
jgi:hypothetical protein